MASSGSSTSTAASPLCSSCKTLCGDAGPDRTLLDGVSVIASPLFELPVLVDAQGDNHEL